MKPGAGRYSRIYCEFDLDHEITKSVAELTEILEDVNEFSEKDSKAIKKAMIETLLNDL